MISFPGWWRGGDALAIDLVKRDLQCEATKCYKGFIVRSRLKRVLNEAVKCNTLADEEV